ncbi:transcriptional regulator with XRE-family HTH domain [Anaerosolibacter carboniphilus]|uniref:Transcriptional regulator with XRE-family HTH domain n=1 Tax=Anaerosolibacter carboniphilus TaxID=1417629 RepID=A0A841KVZ0_9FIRM|nr:helix-turn-helix transcriptional regulator [Anaerosolibacter carboniphilus]MBB6217543.1 transcriptional regulator with XRE-family HTH domain [Anaerosolibacter carboniphilus]
MLGDNIKYFREIKGFNKKELAELIGVTPAYLSLIENNERKNPAIDTIQKIADILNVSVDDLLKDRLNEEITKNSDEKTHIDTIAAHLEGKNITPKKLKLIEQYIEALFEDDDE